MARRAKTHARATHRRMELPSGPPEVMIQIREMKLGPQQRLDAKIATEWRIMEWIVDLCTVLINR